MSTNKEDDRSVCIDNYMNLALHLSREISSVSKKIKKQCFLGVLFSCWSPPDCWQWGLPISFSQQLCAHVRILSSSVPAEVLTVLSLSRRTAKPPFSEATMALEWSNILSFIYHVVLDKSHPLQEPDSSPARRGTRLPTSSGCGMDTRSPDCECREKQRCYCHPLPQNRRAVTVSTTSGHVTPGIPPARSPLILGTSEPCEEASIVHSL